MKKLIYSLIFLFTVYHYSAQQSEDFFYFETCYNIAKANRSDKEVEKYFKFKGKFQPKEYLYYYDIAYYFLRQKNFSKAYKYMTIAIQHGLSFEMTRNFEIRDFDQKHQKLIRENFLKDRNKTIRYFYVNGSGDLFKFQFMRGLLTAEQTARYQLDFTGYENKTAWNYIGYVDSLNMDTLVKFIKAFGMVNNSNVGGDAVMGILFLHLKRYNNPYLDSCIKDNCVKHLLHPDAYTFAIDQDQKEGTSLYGSFGNITDTTIFLDIKNVDVLRNAVGLPSLYEQSLYQHFKLPKDYIIPVGQQKKYEKFLLETEQKKRDTTK